MKVQEAIFKFRGWVFTWKPTKKRKRQQGRKITVWKVSVMRTRLKSVTDSWTVTAFVPSACICRRIKRRILE